MEREKLIKEAENKQINDINPIVAIPYSTSVYSISLSKGPKWLFTGGEDGIIRKFDFFQSIQGKSLLTVSQRHQLIDSILFNGVICSYWENEIPQNKLNNNYDPILSPCYSLAIEKNGFWLLSGLKNGGITLQSIRSNEGNIQYYFKNSNLYSNFDSNFKLSHSDSVSCLQLNSNQTNFLSGSWDMKILKWDLNTGKNLNYFNKSTGQISSLQYRPIIGTDMNWKPEINDDDYDDDEYNGLRNNTLNGNRNNSNNNNDSDSSMDSLFADDDDSDDDDSDKEKKKELDNNIGDKDKDTDKQQKLNEEDTLSNNPDAKKDIKKIQNDVLTSGNCEEQITSDDIFLSSSINGIIDIWDSRIVYKNNNVLKIPTSNNVPPWCTSATWSVDGDSIFVGRRNSTIEEIDLRFPDKVKNILKFPSASGSISCVRTLPNKNYILCGCQDNIRLYDLRLINSPKKIPFTIIPGHNSGILSDMYVDPTCRFMVSASGNRGWQGRSNDYVFIYELLS